MLLIQEDSGVEDRIGSLRLLVRIDEFLVDLQETFTVEVVREVRINVDHVIFHDLIQIFNQNRLYFKLEEIIVAVRVDRRHLVASPVNACLTKRFAVLVGLSQIILTSGYEVVVCRYALGSANDMNIACAARDQAVHRCTRCASSP